MLVSFFRKFVIKILKLCSTSLTTLIQMWNKAACHCLLVVQISSFGILFGHKFAGIGDLFTEKAPLKRI